MTIPKKYKKQLFFVLISTICCCCNPKGEKEKTVENGDVNKPLFTLLHPEETGVQFVNTVKNQQHFNIFKYRNFYNGGGVAIGDINNDSLPDIYFTANMGPNKLYLNKGNFTFEDISETAGVSGNKPWSTGVNMVDINHDGFLDIYVSNAGNMEGNNHDNDLYINNGDLTFTEKAAAYHLAKTGFSTHASFFDYDKDGDLDAYILNNSNIPVSSLGYAEQREIRAQDWEGVPEIFRGVGDMLLRNDNGKFTDVSKDAGIYGSLIGFGLGVMITDINGDLYPDIYVSNDFYERDYLYINNKNGTFTETIKDWTAHLCLSAMGVDAADINNDGNIDVFITDMLPEEETRVKSVMEFEGYNVFKLKQQKDFYQQYIQNTLQLNNGNGSFSEIAYFSGISATDWSWAGLLFDMDNDGFRDLYVTNGINHDLTDLDFIDFFADEIIQNMALTGKKEAIDAIIDKMPVVPIPNYAFRNNQDMTFNNMVKDWGFATPSMSNGAAYGDLDNDGDLDLVVNNVNMPAFLYRNTTETTDNHYIKLRLEGTHANTFAIGSTVWLYYNNNVIVQELMPSRGFQSSMDPVMTIGVGSTSTIDSIRIIWPDNRTQKLQQVTTNKFLTLKQDDAIEIYHPKKKKKKKPLLKELSNTALSAHRENNYNDFDYEGLIAKMLSQEGPALAIGDINNDGNDDLYIGGAKGQSGMLYIHKGKGNIVPTNQPVFAEDAMYEDTAAAFFDADNDGDLDLMTGSGGNQIDEEKTYRNRLYLNDGKGHFSKAEHPLPSAFKNTAVIAPYDIDDDGDIDVFIGSRSVVGTYGISPNHLFLENNGDGTFTDATQRIAYALHDSGMITDALWIDIDNDTRKDLVTVSEWDTPKIYKNQGERLVRYTTSLDRLHGWWNSIEAADLDNDGDLDFILGNQGNNTHYKTSESYPMKLWIHDFDTNGTIEQITTQHIDGNDYPIHQKKELTAQIISLKKQNLKASEYAKKTVNQLFPTDIVAQAIVKKAAISETIIAVNEGNGVFTVKKLPDNVQLSCVCGMVCTDINNDGYIDLVMGGNHFEFKPQYSRLDANYGSVILNNGNLEFTWQPYHTSGFFIKEEIKHIKSFKDKEGTVYLITAINNGKPKLFTIDE